MHMATTQLLFLSIIFLPVLPGADAVSTVSTVAVQRGRSVTIPCHYDKKYEKHEKYWCRESGWKTCHTLVRTDSTNVRGRTSITDDPTHHVFTVTMTKLTGQDTGYYSCCVDIDWDLDDCTNLHLSVTAGADAVSTVSNVAVQNGRSVTIPCHYDKKYEKHVKYWCRWLDWKTCRTLVRTDSPKVEGETSITDDPTHHVFTVTIKSLTEQHTGYYWCGVEIKGVGDEGKYLYLWVIAGTPGLWVDQQEVTGVEGGHVSVQCHTNYPSSMKKWCRAEGSCVEVNSDKSRRSEIKDDHSKKVFIVTMRELNREDTGWYWCATGELQIPVHITVIQKTTTTTVTSISTETTSATATKPSTSKMLAVTIPRSSIPPTTPYNKSPSDLIIVLMTSGILLLAAAVATITWKLWKKHKSAQVNARAREDRSIKLTQNVDSVDEVTYSTVFTKTQSSSHRMSPPQSQSSESSADEVMYCSVILQNPQATHSPNQSPAGTADDVIYSSVAQQK